MPSIPPRRSANPAQISASLLRQLTYSTVRFGIYEHLKTQLPPSRRSSQPSIFHLALLSSAAGFLGGLAGNPADVLNVRMQHDAALPPARRRNYRHALDGLARVVREEGGARALWRGALPNCLRAALMTAAQLASYDVAKRALLARTEMRDGPAAHVAASVAAGFVATTVCSPVDVIKTRVMSAAGGGGGAGGGGVVAVLRDTVRREGLRWVFRGWVPSFMRLGPQTVATFVFLEQHKKAYRYLRGTDAAADERV
jgi:dicarboxylate transporter 10